uniref:Uncharacterized protein n=1 Tax=Chrysotila carterae TaxID=13221 RepID=A0A7S4BGY5_CHRCT
MYGPVRRACSSSSTQRFALRVACGVGFTLVYSAETPSGQRPSVVLFGEMKGIEPTEAADVRGLVHLPELDGINIARLTAGAFHGMALTDGGELWSFGDWSGPDSANGSLLGREWTASSDYARPAKVSLKHLQQDKDKLPPTLLELDSSTYSTIAVTSDGAAVTWGDSDGHGLGHTLGRCSVPTKVAIDDPVAHAAIAFTSGILVTAKQAIYTWGGGMWDGGIGGDHSEPTQLEWEFPEGYECARICISMGHGVLILRRKASRR